MTSQADEAPGPDSGASSQVVSVDHSDSPKLRESKYDQLETPAAISGQVSNLPVNQKSERPPELAGEVTHVDRVREVLAKRLLHTVWVLLAVGFGLMATTKWTGITQDALRSMFDMAFTALIALVSSVIGFYFGSERK